MNNFEEFAALRQLVNALDSDGEPMISYVLKASAIFGGSPLMLYRE